MKYLSQPLIFRDLLFSLRSIFMFSFHDGYKHPKLLSSSPVHARKFLGHHVKHFWTNLPVPTTFSIIMVKSREYFVSCNILPRYCISLVFTILRNLWYLCTTRRTLSFIFLYLQFGNKIIVQIPPYVSSYLSLKSRFHTCIEEQTECGTCVL